MQDNQSDSQPALQGNLICIAQNVYLNIKRMTICADLQDANGDMLGGGDYEATLNAEEIAALQIQSNIPLVDKFNASV